MIQLRNWQKINRPFTKEHVWMANKHMSRYSTPFVLRKIQIETTVKCHCTPLEWVILIKWPHQVLVRMWRNGNSHGNERWYNHFGKQFGCFFKELTMCLQHNPAILLLGIYPRVKKAWVLTEICIWMFIVVL